MGQNADTRRANRRENAAARREAKAQRQSGRQGFLTGVIGNLTAEGGVVDRALAGGGPSPDFKSLDTDTPSDDKTMLYVGLAAAAGLLFFMNKKK